MSRFVVLFSVVAVLAALLTNSGAAQAQASRTWVSGVGDDANPCSRTAPCKTFAGAISKTATGGEINALDDGGFGSVTIVKSITIDGGGHLAGILSSGTFGITVNITNPSDPGNVILRGLDINGTTGSNGPGTYGIRFIAGKSLLVEDTKIYGFGATGSGHGIDFEPSAASTLAVNNVTASNNVGFGVLIKPQSSGSATATLNQLFGYNNGAAVRAEDNSKVTVRDSVASSNVYNGYVAFSTSAAVDVNIERSLAMGQTGTTSSAGVRAVGAAATVRLFNVSIFDNSVGLATGGGAQIIGTSPATTDVAGNGSTAGVGGTVPLL